jgi:hypothetical protein
MVSAHSKVRLLVLGFLALAQSLLAADSPGLLAFVKAVNQDDSETALARFAENYLGPDQSLDKRLQLVREIQRKRHDYLRYLVRSSADIKDPEIRSAVGSAVLETVSSVQDWNSLYLDLNRVLKEHPEELYVRGQKLLGTGNEKEKNKSLAYDLFYLGQRLNDPSKFSPENIKQLFRAGVTSDEIQNLLIEKVPSEAPELLLSLFASNGKFKGSYFTGKESVYDKSFATSEIEVSDIRHVRQLIAEGKISLTEQGGKFLSKQILDSQVSPEAKAIAYDILKTQSGSTAKEVISSLLSSKNPVDHLVADTILGDRISPEQQSRIRKGFGEDLLRAEDPEIISLVARRALASQIDWKKVEFGLNEIQGLKRIIQNPDEKAAQLALDILSQKGQTFGLLPDLLREHLTKEPKTEAEGIILNSGHNEALSGNLRETLKRFPKEMKESENILIEGLVKFENSLPKKKFALELLKDAGLGDSALPTFLSAISQRRNNQGAEELAWMANEASQMARENPEVFKSYEEALESKLRRLRNEPALIGNLRPKDPFEEKMAVAQVLSRMGSKNAIDFLVEELKKPLDPEVPEVRRPKYARLAQALATAIKDDPKILDAKLRQDIRELLASRDPKLTAAQNDLNRYLPSELTQALDQEVMEDRIHPSNTDSCVVMCRVAKELSGKITDSLSVPSDKYLGSNEAKGSFSFAVRSLMGEFLLKANQTGCEIPGIEGKLDKLMKEANELSKKGEGKEDAKQRDDVREAIQASGASGTAIKSALAFLNKTQSSPNTDAKGLPTNSATLYFYLQTQRAAEALKLSGATTDPKIMEELERRIEENLSKIMDARSELLRGEGGSLVTTYALAAIGASLPAGSKTQMQVAHIFSALREDFKKNSGEGFPYNFNPQLLKETERAGAARSVVAELAIYKGGTGEQRLANADTLLRSLGTYEKHFRDVFSGIGLNRTHDYDDADQLAPYYGPSTIPYAFEALSLLGKEPGLTSEQKERLKLLKGNLEKKLLGMFEPNGLFQAQNSNYYTAAPLYDNALTGLALQQACQDKRKSTPSEASTDVMRPTLPKRNH